MHPASTLSTRHPAARLFLLAVGVLLLQALGVTDAQAQSSSGVRSFKDMIKSVSSKDLLKLWSDTKVQAASDITAQISSREVGKTGTYRGTVTKIEQHIFQATKTTGWRLGVEDSIRRGADTLGVFTWLIIQTDPRGLIPRIRIGDEVTVTGTVNRTEVSVTDNPRLNVDLLIPEMNDGKPAPAAAGASTAARPAATTGSSKTPAPAAAAQPAADYPLDRILDALPEAIRAKLSTAPLAPAELPAINEALTALAMRKPMRLTFKIEVKGPLPERPADYQIRASNGLLSGKYAGVQTQWVHLYMPTAKAGALAQTPLGSTVTLTGTITRCDIVSRPPAITQFNLNLADAQPVAP